MTERDLFVGAELPLAGRRFALVEADEFTYNFMENNAASCGIEVADFAAAAQALRAQLAAPGRLEALLSALGDGADQQGFLAALAGVGCQLVPHAAITIFRRLRQEGGGVLLPELLERAVGGP